MAFAENKKGRGNAPPEKIVYLIYYDSLLLALFIFGELSDSDYKIQIYCFESVSVLDQDRTVADFLDRTADLMAGVKCVNQTVFADESFCQFDHFFIALLFSSLDCFSRNHGSSIAEHHVQNNENNDERYVI